MRYRLCLSFIIVLAVFSIASGKEITDDLDIIFLQTNDVNNHLYGLDLDTPSQVVALTDESSPSIQDFDIFEDWLVYSYDELDLSQLMLLNWKTQETHVFLDCSAYNLDCTQSPVYFSSDGEKVFLETWMGGSTVWMINRDNPVPQVFARYEAISSVNWLSDTQFLYSFRDYNHNIHRMLYNTISLGAVNVDLIIDAENSEASIVAVSPDGSKLVVYNRYVSEQEIVLVNLADATQQHYPLTDTGFAPYPGLVNDHYLYDLVWKPDGTGFLYLTADGLFFYDLATPTIRPLWTGALVSEAKWNADGSQIIFVVGSLYQPGELWLYDIEHNLAVSLSVSGFRVQWVDDGL